MEIGWSATWGLFRMDLLSLVMVGLIAFIGLVILRYSRNYLAGEAGRGRFTAWFMAVLGCVLVLVTSNHLFLMATAWICTSLSLHQLLVFYPERPAAMLAAHKKFLISRVGDICLLGGFFLIWRHFGSFRLDEILPAAAAHAGPLPISLEAGSLLLAMATILKCAQLPFHGWLIQVMEAPTPVSALLHAGVVNIGGFLMIRLSPILVEAQAAQGLLVVVGSTSAVVAGLIMMTRVSIKVHLAWSTTAQMGFMLLECGLGAYSLALLHLLAHSLYKAWTFLGSGRVMGEASLRNNVRVEQKGVLGHWLLAPLVALGGVWLTAWIFHIDPFAEPALWAFGGILVLALSTLFAESLALREGKPWLFLAAISLVMGLLYFGWHHLFVAWFGSAAPTGRPSAWMIGWVLGAFLLQYGILGLIRLFPGLRVVRRLHSYLYYGLYLDELFTFLTLRIWPLVR